VNKLTAIKRASTTAPRTDAGIAGRAGRLLGRWPGWVLLLLALIVTSRLLSDYNAYVVALVLIAAIQAASMNLSLGFAGLLSFAQLAFFAIGAYGVVVLVDKHGFAFPLAILIMVVVVAVMAAVFGFIAIRFTSGLFLALVTFALSEVVRLVATTWYDVTGGPIGLIVTFKPTLFGYDYSSTANSMVVFSVVLVLTLGVTSAIVRRPLGQRLLAIREDEFLAEAIGIPVLRYQVAIFAASAALAALIGALSAPFTQVITPSMMNIAALIPLVGMVVVGGKGTVLGPVIGAIIFTLPPVLFTSLGALNGILLGLVVILTTLYMPHGLLSRWRPELTMHPGNLISRGAK
jgi:branched-chain amino acid transport system permease protein